MLGISPPSFMETACLSDSQHYSTFFITTSVTTSHSHTIFTFYNLWQSDKSTIHHPQYYNMKHRKFMWINGDDHLRMEPVLPERSDITLGLNGAERPDVMREKLESLRDREVDLTKQ
jgi:hypothetical protein